MKYPYVCCRNCWTGPLLRGRKAALAGTFSESSFHKGSLAATWAEEYPTPMAARIATVHHLLMTLIQPIGPLPQVRKQHAELS